MNGMKQRFDAVSPFLDERQKRLFVASEAKSYGTGGISVAARETGMSRSTIALGIRELQHPNEPENTRIRKAGGGRKRTADTDATLKSDLESLIEPFTLGDPESPLRWTCKSVRNLATELNRMGHKITHRIVAELLHEMKYSLQGNQKVLEGESHPDRNAQFEYIHQKVKQYQVDQQPVISVDTKKKELVGDFKNGGKELRPQKDPEKVRVHDFKIKELGKVNPYGIYDITQNTGWVNVGIDHDTATFAVESIRRWWYSMGKEVYPEAANLLITADSGGSNGRRVRLWKVELQKLADETKLSIAVSHFPPGTSKWNKIEHRLFSSITQNWRGKPLINHETIINLIASTTTITGLRVKCELDENIYPTKTKISKKMMSQINMEPDKFHPEWNYVIKPTQL